MKWYVIPSLLACGLNCTLGTVVLSLVIYHLYTDKSTNAPIPPNEAWISRMTGLIPFTVVWIVVSFLAIFVSLTRNRIWIATSTLILYVVCFGISVYYAYGFSSQLEMEDATADSLLKITQNQITNEAVHNWIPGWLDNIQKQSKKCCGIITYRDYEQFWSDTPTKLPRSCCRDENVLPSPCPNDLTHIPYPNTPAIYYKVETGCMDDINENTRLHILETFHNCVIMAVFVGIGVIAFLLLFVKRYLVSNPKDDQVKMKVGGVPCESCRVKDDGDGNQGPVQINSDAYPPLPPAIDSYEGPGSMDSIAASSMGVNRMAETTNSNANYQYIAPTPRTNTVVAGLQTQRQPEASTGDDTMTINAGNMGKHEIFVAQDNPVADTSAGRGALQSSKSVDDVGDVIHEDDAVNSPPGSPGGKRKKVRKVGGHHHKKHHHHTTTTEQ